MMDLSIQELYKRYLLGKRGLRLSSISTYVRNVNIFLTKTGLTPDTVTNQRILDYITDMKIKQYKNDNTRRLMKRSITSFFTWYAQYAGIGNPAIDLPEIKKYRSYPKLIHPDELERMLYAADQIWEGDRAKRASAILAFLADTGVRIGEYENIKAGAIRLAKDRNGNKHFEVTVPAIKGTYERVIPFSNLIEGSLSEYFARYYLWLITEKQQKPGQPLFFHLECNSPVIKEDLTKPLKRAGVDYILRKCSYDAGIDRRVSPHQFRHFYGTYSILNGMDIWALKEYMGHASIATTQEYIHIAHTLSGRALKYGPTVGLKSQKYLTGYSEILKELSE